LRPLANERRTTIFWQIFIYLFPQLTEKLKPQQVDCFTSLCTKGKPEDRKILNPSDQSVGSNVIRNPAEYVNPYDNVNPPNHLSATNGFQNYLFNNLGAGLNDNPPNANGNDGKQLLPPQSGKKDTAAAQDQEKQDPMTPMHGTMHQGQIPYLGYVNRNTSGNVTDSLLSGLRGTIQASASSPDQPNQSAKSSGGLTNDINNFPQNYNNSLPNQ
jgi:hypothetical protein